MSQFSIYSQHVRTLKDGTIKGSIYVTVQGRRKKERVEFDYKPNSGYGWNQWGSTTEVLCFTQSTVDRICREGDYS